MVTLSLFRHAKSSWAESGLRDFERPLAPRGKEAAPKMGAFMESQGLVPDLVLCSPAARAMETLEHALPELAERPEIRYQEGLYHAGPHQMLQLLNDVDTRIGHVMLIGHNPGMHGLALRLAGSGEEDALQALRQKFPTAGLAVIEFEEVWQQIAPGLGFLRLFMVPRRLPD
jgi:phosphohistidine phosphatase